MAREMQEKKFEVWKQGLLDVGKRNQMVNFKRMKNSTIGIEGPEGIELFQKLVSDEEMINADKLETELPYKELIPVYNNLRTKNKAAMEEQGVHALYMCFGFLTWKRKGDPDFMEAPLVLVPVNLLLNAVTLPYQFKKTNQDVVFNPTLQYILASEFGLHIPEPDLEEVNLYEYLDQIAEMIEPMGWTVNRNTAVGLLSFQKIVMYRDLESHKEMIFENPVIKAFCGDDSDLVKWDENWYGDGHDSVPAEKDFMVVSGDASQQDAILLSKKGFSFVLQGPPGTGKSQTITNIISSALADDKRVLFVSEKLAALDVVYTKLQENGLGDACLSLHDPKADRREMIAGILRTMDTPLKTVKHGTTDFWPEYEQQRKTLNDYYKDLYQVREPMNQTLYEVIGELSQLEQEPSCPISDAPTKVSRETYGNRMAALKAYQEFLEHYDGEIDENPWKGTNIKLVDYDTRQDLERILGILAPQAEKIARKYSALEEQLPDMKNWNREQELLLSKVMEESSQYVDRARSIAEKKEALDQVCNTDQLMAQFEQDVCAEGGFSQSVQWLNTMLGQKDVPQEWMKDEVYDQVYHLYQDAQGRKSDLAHCRQEYEQFMTEAGFEAKQALWQQHEEHPLPIRQLADDWDACGEQVKTCAGEGGFDLPQEPFHQDSIEAFKLKLNDILAELPMPDASSIPEQIKALHTNPAELTLEQCEKDITALTNNATLKMVIKYRLELFKKLFRVEIRNLEEDLNSVADHFKEWTDTMEVMAGKIKYQKEMLTAEWEPSFLTYRYLPVYNRFKTDYTSLVKHITPQYYKDLEALAKMHKARGKLKDGEYFAGLEQLKEYQETVARFKGMASLHKDLLGPCFGGLDTDWNGVREFGLHYIQEVKTIYTETLKSKQRLATVWKEEFFAQNGALLKKQLEDHLSKSDEKSKARIQCRRLIEQCDQMTELRAQTLRLLQQKTVGFDRITNDTLRKMLELLLQTAKRYEELEKVSDACREAFGEYYRGADTDFDRIKELLEIRNHAMKLLNQKPLTKAQELFWQSLPEDSRYSKMMGEYISLVWQNRNLKEQMIRQMTDLNMTGEVEEWIQRLNRLSDEDSQSTSFHEAMPQLEPYFDDKSNFEKSEYLLGKWVLGLSKLQLLEDQITYERLRNQCKDSGLTAYLEYCAENRLKPAQVTAVYKKSFLTKWYYEVLEKENLTYLQQFQSYAHEQLARDYGESLQKQRNATRVRLAAQMCDKRASVSGFVMEDMEEVAVLKHEAEKKKHVMSLRQLFSLTPNVMRKVKPCMMMSPMSVSYFLDPELYQFDMVIFDEASQIMPEDAVGAIYRGKQVVIAGDSRQMPPTSFFSASLNEDAYDSQSDEEDMGMDACSESILDEANTYLPSCTLLWHYRSRDESLIAFSNKEIYDHRLVTFPNCKKLPDKGVSYVYVEDGVYEGGGKNSNLKEAQRCAQLTEEHILKHPDCSLGIIAFSKRQQAAIEQEIAKLRKAHPEYESFFDEEKEEPFFVKNLENVQGDERHTIIFSVCYAKNEEGKMFMRFGPLGQSGGERRLNVAITRAKYCIKLVGSILPSDISLEKVSAEGVRLLHGYIAYAIENTQSEPCSGVSEVEDKLADTIADYIRSLGYTVHRNVGASNYKVDLAVVNPDNPNEYMAGIECDSDNYVMAKTAADRDVVRKSIMTQMGWNMHHVWSAAWMKNSKAEQERLKGFLEGKAN